MKGSLPTFARTLRRHGEVSRIAIRRTAGRQGGLASRGWNIFDLLKSRPESVQGAATTLCLQKAESPPFIPGLKLNARFPPIAAVAEAGASLAVPFGSAHIEHPRNDCAGLCAVLIAPDRGRSLPVALSSEAQGAVYGGNAWRPDRESNSGARICSPLRNHSAIRPLKRAVGYQKGRAGATGAIALGGAPDL